MNLQEEINKINERIEALNKDVKSLVDGLEAVMENEFPKLGDEYWYIDEFGTVCSYQSDEFFNKDIIEDMKDIGNIYKTKDQVEFAVEKLKVEAELRKFSRPFVWGEENWILYMSAYRNIFLGYENDEVSQGVIYFGSEDKALEAIDTVGAERIKKYIFGVED